MLVQIYEEKIAKNMISERWERSECLKSFLKITRLEMVLGDKKNGKKEKRREEQNELYSTIIKKKNIWTF